MYETLHEDAFEIRLPHSHWL